MLGMTVLVVDPDSQSRALTVSALLTLGLHAVGVYLPTDAVALLDGLTPDAVLVRSDSPDVATHFLRGHTLLVEVEPSASVEDALSALLHAIHHQPDAASFN
jgi:CheY-like chemotaxis protein